MIRACALQPDIDILPDKDRTEIGDKVTTVFLLVISTLGVKV